MKFKVTKEELFDEMVNYIPRFNVYKVPDEITLEGEPVEDCGNQKVCLKCELVHCELKDYPQPIEEIGIIGKIPPQGATIHTPDLQDVIAKSNEHTRAINELRSK